MKPCKVEIQSAAFGRFFCGDTIQGGIRLCSACTAKLHDERPVKVGKLDMEPEDLTGFPTEKRDFDCLDVRLYLALKDMVKIIDDNTHHSLNFKDSPQLAAARSIMRDFEDSHGPLPEWAIARNFGLELVEGAQLCTLDGRRHGNGWIVGVTEKYDPNIANRDNPYGETTVYDVLTDAGSAIRGMSEAEVLSGWAVGEWICTRDRILSRFDHDKSYEV